MKRIENGNPNTPRPGMRRDAGSGEQSPTYERTSLDGNYTAWYAPVGTTIVGNGVFRSWSMAPNALPGRGTNHYQEYAARRAVDYFMDVSVPRQREERAGHTLPPDRLEYINDQLTIIDYAAQYNRYFVAPEKPDEAPGSVGTVEAVTNGLGRYHLRRHKRLEDGSLQVQRPDPQVEAYLEPLYTNDIHANDGNWGADDDGQWYPVAADVANAAFPGTYPPYEPRRLPQDDEQLVLTRRRAGLVGDPVAGRPNEEERLYEQRMQHLDDKARQRDVPEAYEL